MSPVHSVYVPLTFTACGLEFSQCTNGCIFPLLKNLCMYGATWLSALIDTTSTSLLFELGERALQGISEIGCCPFRTGLDILPGGVTCIL